MNHRNQESIDVARKMREKVGTYVDALWDKITHVDVQVDHIDVAVEQMAHQAELIEAAPAMRNAKVKTAEIHTEDLTELSVVNVTVGQAVSVTFDALPDLTLPGIVARIKPLGENKQGDITYTVIIEPQASDPRLRWNMTAVATLE